MLDNIKILKDKINTGQIALNKATMISSLSNAIEKDLVEISQSLAKPNKKLVITELKKYDILYIQTFGTAHYLLIHRVDIHENLVYGVTFTSTYKSELCLHKVERDRLLVNSWATSGYLAIPLDIAQVSFVKVFEYKKEANIIFQTTINYYKKIFKLK